MQFADGGAGGAEGTGFNDTGTFFGTRNLQGIAGRMGLTAAQRTGLPIGGDGGMAPFGGGGGAGGRNAAGVS